MSELEQFERKCASDLLERRSENGEFTTLEKAREYYDRRLLAYYKDKTLTLDLFRVNNDYKELYVLEKKHTDRLRQQCENYKIEISILKNRKR